MLVRHGLSGIGDDLRRAASTCTATVRREMFEALERRGQTELHRDSSNRSWCKRAASLRVVFGGGVAWSDGKVKEGAAVGHLSSRSLGRTECSWPNLASEYPVIVS
ncbi:hypothetical protein Dimus_032149 [Dionaea muscipula]